MVDKDPWPESLFMFLNTSSTLPDFRGRGCFCELMFEMRCLIRAGPLEVTCLMCTGFVLVVSLDTSGDVEMFEMRCLIRAGPLEVTCLMCTGFVLVVSLDTSGDVEMFEMRCLIRAGPLEVTCLMCTGFVLVVSLDTSGDVETGVPVRREGERYGRKEGEGAWSGCVPLAEWVVRGEGM